MALIKTFVGTGMEFSAAHSAEEFLTSAGFSVGRMQRADPRGILFGDFDIQKWRNLNAHERRELHGYMQGNMRIGPVKIEIYDTAPPEAKRAFHQAATAYAE